MSEDGGTMVQKGSWGTVCPRPCELQPQGSSLGVEKNFSTSVGQKRSQLGRKKFSSVLQRFFQLVGELKRHETD